MAWCTPAACARDDDLREIVDELVAGDVAMGVNQHSDGLRHSAVGLRPSGCHDADCRCHRSGLTSLKADVSRDASLPDYAVPGAGGVSKPMSCALPSVSAARTIPCDTRPIIGRGARLATKAIVRPTMASGA